MIAQLSSLPAWLDGTENRNLGTLWQVVKAYQANLRQGTVGVKTRSQVRGTGIKPYRQKKTGNARRGTFFSPHHVGGGVAHGPKARSYRQGIPPKMGALALKIALAKRILSGNVFAGTAKVDSGKTKDAASLIQAAHGPVGKTVVCLANPAPETLRAYRNIRGVELVGPENLTALDVVISRNLVVSDEALKVLEARLGKYTSKTEAK